MGTGLEPGLSMGGPSMEVDLIGRATTKPCVRPVFVIPVQHQSDLVPKDLTTQSKNGGVRTGTQLVFGDYDHHTYTGSGDDNWLATDAGEYTEDGDTGYSSSQDNYSGSETYDSDGHNDASYSYNANDSNGGASRTGHNTYSYTGDAMRSGSTDSSGTSSATTHEEWHSDSASGPDGSRHTMSEIHEGTRSHSGTFTYSDASTSYTMPMNMTFAIGVPSGTGGVHGCRRQKRRMRQG
jgi:hypothetical protein